MASYKALQLAKRRGYGTFYTWEFEIEVYCSINKNFGSNRDTMMVHDHEVDAKIREIMQNCIKELEKIDNVSAKGILK